MYCPRCGMPNTETTKFCQECGLALMPVAGYVASGGTGRLSSPPPPPSSMKSPLEGLSPKQRLILTIVALVSAPAIFGVLSSIPGLGSLGGSLAGLSSVVMPIGIFWAIFRYKSQMLLLNHQRRQQGIQSGSPVAAPAFQPQNQQPPLEPRRTNPLKTPVPPSVTEDETHRLPERDR